MEISTWFTGCEWKAQYVSPIAKGETREQAIEALKIECGNVTTNMQENSKT